MVPLAKNKPFALLQTRSDDAAAAGEYASVARVAGLPPQWLERHRLDQGSLGPIDLSRYSGLILGGSDYCASSATKSQIQVRAESELHRLLDQVIDQDFPFLGLCYGIGLITSHLGGQVDGTYSEPVGAAAIKLTPEGQADPLLKGAPPKFHAFVGHKEAATSLPPGTTVLATGSSCPVQLYRVGRNVYASQYHAELDAPDLVTRMALYKHHGYFRPEELDDLSRAAHDAPLDGSQHHLLKEFVARHSQPA